MSTKEKFNIVTLFSSIITIIQSVFWIILSATSMAFRNDCSSADYLMKHGSDYIWFLFYRQYILDESCGTYIVLSNVVTPRVVHIFTITSLTFAFINLIASILLLLASQVKSYKNQLETAMYLHVISYFVGFIVDMMFSMLFALDYLGMTAAMNRNKAGYNINYDSDGLRIAIFMVSILVAKGIMAPIINLVMILLIIRYFIHFYQEYYSEMIEAHRQRLRAETSSAVYDVEMDPDPESQESPSVFRPITSRAALRVLGDDRNASYENVELTPINAALTHQRSPTRVSNLDGEFSSMRSIRDRSRVLASEPVTFTITNFNVQAATAAFDDSDPEAITSL